MLNSDTPELHTAMSGTLTFGKEFKKFALMSMYEQRRSIHKNLETLRKLQAGRKRLHFFNLGSSGQSQPPVGVERRLRHLRWPETHTFRRRLGKTRRTQPL